MTDQRISAYAKGVLGETRACDYLCKRGMILLEQRYHSPFGEIDLIMRDGETVVFVEVKLRERGRAHDGFAAITPVKRRRLLQTAQCYITEHALDCPMRFDALEITRDGICHLPNVLLDS
ncbi:MAG: YraN family protein [Clostridia bacterium]